MEHMGHYYEALAHQLSEAKLFVSVINQNLSKILIMTIFAKLNLIELTLLKFINMHLKMVKSQTVESLRILMNKTTSKLPEYPVVIAMTGVGSSLGPQLMFEIGDISYFTHKSAIPAFAGIDPGANRSGSYKQKMFQFLNEETLIYAKKRSSR